MAHDSWAYAREEASAAGETHLSNVHLLLGLARTTGPASDVLADLGATQESLRRVLNANRQNVGRGSKQPSSVRETPESAHTRGRAQGIALGLGQTESNEHLLMALAYDRLGSHGGILRSLNIGAHDLIEGLRGRKVATPPATPAPFRQPTDGEVVVLPTPHARIVMAALEQLLREGSRERVINEFGEGRWGYGAVEDEPGLTRIEAEPTVRLREVVETALAAAGVPTPPSESWAPTLV